MPPPSRASSRGFPQPRRDRPPIPIAKMRYKIEVQDDSGLWTDVRGQDHAVLVFDDEESARAALAERFPILVQMEKYAGGKRTRVIRIIEDENDWPARRPQTK
jgi:hypothetical protein